MSPSTIQESVTVTGEAPLVETTKSSLGSNVDARQMQELPLNGRNFIDLLLATPGAVRDVRGGDISVAGQRGTANSMLVDGADSNNLFFAQALGRTAIYRRPLRRVIISGRP